MGAARLFDDLVVGEISKIFTYLSIIDHIINKKLYLIGGLPMSAKNPVRSWGLREKCHRTYVYLAAQDREITVN